MPNLERSPGVTGERSRSAHRAVSHLALLLALAVRIRLRLVDDQPVIEVRDASRDVAHELRDARHVIVVDVLRLVGHLVVVASDRRSRRTRSGFRSARTCSDRCGSRCSADGRWRRTRSRTCRCGLRRRVHRLDEVAELRREPARADELHVARSRRGEPPSLLASDVARAPRPIMSMLSCATIESRGTVG